MTVLLIKWGGGDNLTAKCFSLFTFAGAHFHSERRCKPAKTWCCKFTRQNEWHSTWESQCPGGEENNGWAKQQTPLSGRLLFGIFLLPPPTFSISKHHMRSIAPCAKAEEFPMKKANSGWMWISSNISKKVYSINTFILKLTSCCCFYPEIHTWDAEQPAPERSR